MAEITRVYLITGFLGSGKTTFLNRIIDAFPKDKKLTLLVNEFGEIGVDGTLVEGDEIDMTPHIWEEIFISAPSKFLCKDDCAGLCTTCGINLNNETCACSDKSKDIAENSGFEALGDMFPDLKPDKSED